LQQWKISVRYQILEDRFADLRLGESYLARTKGKGEKGERIWEKHREGGEA